MYLFNRIDIIFKIGVLWKKLPGLILAAFLSFILFEPLNVYADTPVIVVLDPGHGGSNTGAIHNGFVEKEMNLVVAHAMREELEKYEGVVVYLTHNDTERDMSLKERAAFAAERNADLLLSLHFNMSESHMLYGAEVWVSAFGTYYARGHAFAQIQMAAYQELGLFNRGIKTRLNDRGEDYYGIIRENRLLGVNAVLLEHCHLDHIIDQAYYALGDYQLEEFGRLSATSVAKYFGLRSSILEVDYSDFPVPYVTVPYEVVRPDLSPPDVCHIELLHLDEEARTAVINLTAEDYDSRILYYGVSLDGGVSFDILVGFPDDESELTITVDLPAERNIRLLVAAYNAYDRITQSNVIEIAALPGDEVLSDAVSEESEDDVVEVSLVEFTEELIERQEQMGGGFEIYFFIIIGIIILMLVVVVVFISRVFLLRKLWKKKE